MKLLASSCYMAAKTRTASGKIYGAARACAAQGAVAMDYLAIAVEQVLSAGKCSVADVDLIVSLSWSPDHLVADTRIMGPRIGHPLQKKMGAQHAFVFDLMDASLAKALYIVNQFSLAQPVRRVLLVRADIGHGLRADPDSGFTIPDGAFALLLEPDAGQQFFSAPVSGHSSSASAFQPLRVELNTKIVSADDAKGTFCFPAQQGLSEAINRQAQALIHSAGFGVHNTVIEHWLSHEADRPHCLGPFDLAFQMQMRLEFNRGSLLAISFDPFGLTLEGVTLQVTGAAHV